MREKLVAGFRFVILNPTGGRASFKIDRRPGKRVKHPDLDAINAAYKSGQLDFESAKKAVEELRYRLYREERALRVVVHNSDNSRLLEQYWASEYAHRELQDAQTARYELERAIRALGMLSIYSASRDEIQRCVDVYKGNRQRRIVASLRRLLVFARRTEIRLRPAKREKRRVKSLSRSEFASVLTHVPLDTLSTLMQVAYFTGARIGECFAIEEQDFDEDKLELRIYGQVDKKGVSRDTKNRRDRVTLVFPSGVAALKRWFTLKGTIEPGLRAHMAEIVNQACTKEFPANPSKHLTFHDLRHCYARLCRESGLTTEDVADLIGDSVLVAKEHYSGFGPTLAIMDSRRKAIKKK